MARLDRTLIVIGFAALWAASSPLSLATSAAASSSRQTSAIGTQAILNKIHHIAIPSDPWKPGQKRWVRPTSGFLRPSGVKFRTDCGDHGGRGAWGNYYSYRRFKLSAATGLSDTPCNAMVGGMYRVPNRNQYLEPLNRMGLKVQRAVGLSSTQRATSISGDRKAVTAKFDTSDGGTVSSITIYRNKTATITTT